MTSKWLFAITAIVVFAAAVAAGAATKADRGTALPIDPTFNGGSELPLTLDGKPVTTATALIALTDGRIVVKTDTGLIGLKNDGSPDLGFGVDGVVPESGISIHAAPDGGLFVLGIQTRARNERPVITRYDAGGKIVKRWASNGSAYIPHFDVESAAQVRASRLDVADDGSIAIASMSAGREPYIAVSKLDSRGRLLRVFGRRGVATVSYRALASNGGYLVGIARAGGGKVVVTGYLPSTTDCEPDLCPRDEILEPIAFVKKLKKSGRADRSFSRDGFAIASKNFTCDVNGSLTTTRGTYFSESCGSAALISRTGREIRIRANGVFGWSDNTTFDPGDEVLHQRRDGTIIAVATTAGGGGFGERASLVFRRLGPRGFRAGGAGNSNSSVIQFSYGFMDDALPVAVTFDRADQPIVLANRFDAGDDGPHRAYLARLRP